MNYSFKPQLDLVLLIGFGSSVCLTPRHEDTHHLSMAVALAVTGTELKDRAIIPPVAS